MGTITAAINMTLDGFCDHTHIIADEALHLHYAELLNTADAVLYGRVTYQLMEYWRPMVHHPTGNPSTDHFVTAINRIPKIVFSRTLREVDWSSASLARQEPGEIVSTLRKQSGQRVLVCSPSLILELTRLGLIDEYQICVHPVVAGYGLPLFKEFGEKVLLQLRTIKQFDFGAVVLCYDRVAHPAVVHAPADNNQ